MIALKTVLLAVYGLGCSFGGYCLCLARQRVKAALQAKADAALAAAKSQVDKA